MNDTKPRKFRLSLVNAAEDVPRLIRAYGRVHGGEFALVLRPTERRGVLVLVTKKDGALFWRGPTEPEGGDAPAKPASPISASDAVALVKAEQKAVPKPGPITLRGQWSGWLRCDGGEPRVELERKLATYGVLRIVSGVDGWTWRVERAEKWFSRPGVDTGTASTLVGAIEGGLAQAMGLLGEACSVRDSRRRAALDSAYAVSRPVVPAREGPDPTERMAAKAEEPSRPRAKAGSPWRRYDGGEAPEADPIDRPSRAVLARVKAGGLAHDAGAGSFLGRTVEVFDGFPVGSLVFREPEDDAGFYLHPPLPERARKPRAASDSSAGPAQVASSTPASSDVDAEKDKALLDAFSQAIAAATTR